MRSPPAHICSKGQGHCHCHCCQEKRSPLLTFAVREGVVVVVVVSQKREAPLLTFAVRDRVIV
jgi:hypothetical protein